MKLLGKNLLADISRRHPDIRSALATWEREVEDATWTTPVDVKTRYQKASFVGKDNVIFDIRGGKYRLHARVNYVTALVIVIRVGTHAEYDHWTF
jgi:mRNA interferase HigB